MPSTNEEFVKKAFAAGLTESQVRSAVAERNQVLSSNTTKPEDNRTGFQKVTDFVGLKSTVGNIGALGFSGQGGRTQQAGQTSNNAFQQSQQLTQLAKQEINPQKKKQLLDQARAIMQGSGEQMDEFQTDLSKRQDVARISEKEIERGPEQFAIRRAIGQSAELAALLMPLTKEARAAQAALKLGTAGNRIVQAGKIGATAGGLQGVAGSTREADTLTEAGIRIGGGTIVGGVTGATLQGVFEGGKWGFDKLKGKVRETAINAYKKTLKNNIRDKKFYKQYGGEDKIIKDTVKYKIANTKNGVINQLDDYGDEFGKIMKKEADKMQANGDRINVAQAFKRAKAKVQENFSHDKTLLKQVNNWFDANKFYSQKTNVLPGTSNQIRIKFDRKVGQLVTGDTIGADAGRKAFATELRNAFKGIAQEETKDAITKYSLLSGLADAMQKEPKFGLTEAALAGASPGTGMMNLVELLLGKAARSPGLRRSISQQGINVSPNATNAVNLPVNLGVNPLSAYLQNEVKK